MVKMRICVSFAGGVFIEKLNVAIVAMTINEQAINLKCNFINHVFDIYGVEAAGF